MPSSNSNIEQLRQRLLNLPLLLNREIGHARAAAPIKPAAPRGAVTAVRNEEGTAVR